MGTSRSSAELADKLHRAATTVERANRDTVQALALFAKEQFIEGAVAAGLRRGGTLPSSGRSRWTARYDIKGNAANPVALVRYKGPVHWAFGGTKPHVIGARRLGSRRSIRGAAGGGRGSFGRLRNKTGARALSTPYGPRAYVRHPGSTGRNTWPATKKRVAAGAKRIYGPAYRRALQTSFR